MFKIDVDVVMLLQNKLVVSSANFGDRYIPPIFKWSFYLFIGKMEE